MKCLDSQATDGVCRTCGSKKNVEIHCVGRNFNHMAHAFVILCHDCHTNVCGGGV